MSSVTGVAFRFPRSEKAAGHGTCKRNLFLIRLLVYLLVKIVLFIAGPVEARNADNHFLLLHSCYISCCFVRIAHTGYDGLFDGFLVIIFFFFLLSFLSIGGRSRLLICAAGHQTSASEKRVIKVVRQQIVAPSSRRVHNISHSRRIARTIPRPKLCAVIVRA